MSKYQFHVFPEDSLKIQNGHNYKLEVVDYTIEKYLVNISETDRLTNEEADRIIDETGVLTKEEKEKIEYEMKGHKEKVEVINMDR
jgi:predicted transglutaminase-like protease